MSRFGNIAGGGAPSAAPFSGRRVNTPAPQEDLIEVVGYLDKIRVFGDWGIGDIWTEDRGSVKITGQMVKTLTEGSQYRLTGRIKRHPKYGDSIDVVTAAPHVRLDPRAIEKYMEANFEGIGPKSAKKMVKHAITNGGDAGLENLRQQLLNAPWAIDWSPANREGTFKATSDETAVDFVQRDLTMRLSGVQGMNSLVIGLLARWSFNCRMTDPEFEKTQDPVADSWRILSRDPYAAIPMVNGLGFLLADAIGKMVNVPLDAPHRLSALVAHALKRGCEMEGHVYLRRDQLVESIRQVERTIDPNVAINHGLETNTIVLDDERGQPRYYTPELQDAEDRVAEAIAEMLGDRAPLLTAVNGLDDRIQAAFRQGKQNAASFSLDPSQVAAVRGALTSGSRIHVITGGPGCGKTSLVETEIKMLPGKTFHFGAPTGKASKVLSSRIAQTGNKASTVHSLLRGSEGGWQVNREDPLDGDVLVIDESSMPSLDLYRAILDACNRNMHLILVGDHNQLQSIQPGRVLSDLLEVKGINHAHLTTVHRNGGGILEVVKEIESGKMTCKDHPDVYFSHGLGDAEDFFPVVMNAYMDAVARRGIENVILMMSRRQGEASQPGWNTTYANAVLRDLMNPGAEKIPGSSKMHVSDRIIIRENMSLKQKPQGSNPFADDEDEEEVRHESVVNGDTGQIMSFELHQGKGKGNQSGAAWLRIRLDDGRTIDYPGEALNKLDHSYAMTVHSCQGSEYQEVLAVLTPGAPTFINRSTLYTAASRPRLKMHFFAEDSVLRKIAATPAPRRNSALVEKITERIAEEEDEADVQPTSSSRFRPAA
jgi:exodeoxyribonuclease V alpha subunit